MIQTPHKVNSAAQQPVAQIHVADKPRIFWLDAHDTSDASKMQGRIYVGQPQLIDRYQASGVKGKPAIGMISLDQHQASGVAGVPWLAALDSIDYVLVNAVTPTEIVLVTDSLNPDLQQQVLQVFSGLACPVTHVLMAANNSGQVAKIMTLQNAPASTLGRVLKRSFDIIASGSALLLLTIIPLLPLLALAVRLDSKGVVFYRQQRWGMNGKPFGIYKFRSMYADDCDSGEGHVKQAVQDDSRITRVGAILRKYSLDELPQLLNILKGDMSVIGPRPHAVAHNELYAPLIRNYMRRHQAKPGLSGLAAAYGYRGATPTLDVMQRRVDFDNAYISQWNFFLDISIIIRTVLVVFKRTNAF